MKPIKITQYMYFLFFSYVHMNISKDEILITNTETGVSVLSTNRTFISLINGANLHTFYYAFYYTKESLIDLEFELLINKLQDGYFGDVIPINSADKLPIQIPPQIRMKNNHPLDNSIIQSIDLNKKDHYTLSILDDIEKYILNNVFEISIYYNYLSTDTYQSFSNFFLQHLFPIVSDSKEIADNISLSMIPKLERLFKINLVVGSYTTHLNEYIEQLIKFLPPVVEFCIYTITETINQIPIEILDQFNTVYIWHYELSNIKNKKTTNNQKNLFAITMDFDLEQAYRHPNIDQIIPFYTGQNTDFMNSILNFKKKDMLNEPITEREIFMNQYLNSNFYGELSVFPNGDVFTRRGTKPIGNINKQNIKSILLNEHLHIRNWFLTRNSIKTCKDCALNWLCPPVTNTELLMHNWTFCKDYY